MTITGSDFGGNQQSSSVMFGTTAAAVTSWSRTSIVCTVPAVAAGATTVTVTVGGQTSNAFAFTVDAPAAPAPLIAGVTPSHALAGAAVTITGSGFGAVQGTSTLKFGAAAAAITSWSDTAIVCTVPTMSPGTVTVTVTVGGQTSNAFAFTVDAPAAPAPLMAGVTPSHALAGAAVTITGSGFGATPGASMVLFGGSVASITSWSDTAIVCTVPTMSPGTVTITVTVGGQTSNAFAFTVDAPAGAPQITGLTPPHGLPGASVVVTGSGFGLVQGASTVSFGTSVGAVTSWSATSIACTVPDMAGGTTTVSVTVGGLASNAVPFTVDGAATLPRVSGITPNHGRQGATVTIAGSDFGPLQGASTVKFGSTVAAVTSWSASSIVCTIPAVSPGRQL